MSLTLALCALVLALHSAHLTGLRNTLALILTVWVLALLLKERRRLPLALPVAAWLLLALASASWSVSPTATLKSAVTDILLPLGTFYAAYAVSNQGRAVRLLSVAVAASVGLLVLLALAARAGFESLAHYYPGPGVASTLAVYALPLGLAIAREEERGLRHAGYAVLAFVLLTGMLTLNRAFWPSVSVAFALFAAWHWPILSTAQRKAAVLAIGLAAAGSAAALAYTHSTRAPDDGRRIHALREWSGFAADATWLGHGFGKDSVERLSEGRISTQLLKTDANLRSHAHNLLLNVVLQLGFVGLAVFSLLLWRLAALAYPARDPARVASGAALIALVAAMLAKNMTDDFMDHAVVVAFWLHAGLLAGRLRQAD